MLIVYSVIIVARPNSQAIRNWLNEFDPIAVWLSNYVPALWRVPQELIETGYGEWALATRHVLLAGWIVLFISALWIIVVVLILDPKLWSRTPFSRAGLAKLMLLAIFVVMLMSSCLFFGVVSPPKLFGGRAVPLFIAVYVFMTLFFLLMLVCFLSALARWSDSSDRDPQLEQRIASAPETFRLMRERDGGWPLGRVLSQNTLSAIDRVLGDKGERKANRKSQANR